MSNIATINVLYIGDIMGEPGQETVTALLPGLRDELKLDFVVAQGENLSGGKGMTIEDTEAMMAAGVDFFSGGNWTTHRPDIHAWLEDDNKPVIRPANYPDSVPGKGAKLAHTKHGDILMVSLLGQIVPQTPSEVENPLHTIDEILTEYADTPKIATIVNFHGDYSSEKRVIGYYLAGRASLVVGDHWHVATADPMLINGKTAHITDVGMVGVRDSSLGIELDTIVERWHSGRPSKNELATDGERHFNAVFAQIDVQNGQATQIQQILRTYRP